jgi:hypothetical protein
MACGESSRSRPSGDGAGAPSGGDGETGASAGSGGGSALGGTGAFGGRAGNGAGGTASGREGTGGAPGGEGGAADTGGTAGGGAGGSGGTTAGAGGASAGAGGVPGGGTAGAGAASGTGTSGTGGVPCGGYDEPCCASVPGCNHADAACAPRSRTDSTRLCRRCGVPGAPCCGGHYSAVYEPRVCDGGCCVWWDAQSTWECVAPGDACTIGGACQTDGSCAECGGPGDACCTHGFPNSFPWCTAPFTTCSFPDPRRCEPCGRLNERCCINTERAFGNFMCVAPLACEEQVCVMP